MSQKPRLNPGCSPVDNPSATVELICYADTSSDIVCINSPDQWYHTVVLNYYLKNVKFINKLEKSRVRNSPGIDSVDKIAKIYFISLWYEYIVDR